MVRINANRQPVYERYRDDIQFQFDCVLIESDGGEVQVEGNNAEQKLKGILGSILVLTSSRNNIHP